MGRIAYLLEYPRASKYTDLHRIYTECSGPGGLKLAEFLAEKEAEEDYEVIKKDKGRWVTYGYVIGQEGPSIT